LKSIRTIVMRIVSLIEFIISGDFGGVTIGMSKTELLEKLGEPDEIIDYGIGSCGINYGWYEFYYDKKSKQITGIQNDHLSVWLTKEGINDVDDHKEAIYFENSEFKIDVGFLKYGENLSYTEIVQMLQQESIKFQEIHDFHSGCIIQFASGVTMDFTDFDDQWYINKTMPDKEKLVLNGIRLFEK